MRDLGFDEPEAVGGAAHTELEEKCRELTEELEGVRSEVASIKQAMEAAKASEARTAQKLQSFQQVNRSQSALVRAELAKCRRKLAHTQAIASRLREQAQWLQAQKPAMNLPAHLDGLPSEEEAAEEAAELLQMHRRWENDIVQLQAELQTQHVASSSAAELDEAQHRIAELEASLKQVKEEGEQQTRELEELRKRSLHAAPPTAPQQAPPAKAPTESQPDSTPALRKELEAAEEKSKEQMKKLKQLAQAYKKLEQEKVDIEAKLKNSEGELVAAREEAARPKAPQRAALSPELLRRVQEMMATSRAQLAELRASVRADLHTQVPALLEEVVRGQATDLSKVIEAGTKEWKDKYEIESARRRKLHNLVQEMKGNIRVYCRVRPLAAHESGSCISFPSGDEIQIRQDSTGTKKTWQFNEVFKEDSTQAMVFAGIRDLVVSMIDGYNVCIFAYGQTGAGKTHSMQGTRDNPGLYMRTFNELFKVARERSGWKVELRGALIEVYNEEIRDLLIGPNDKRTKLQVRQGKEGNFVPGLTLQPVSTAEDVDQLLSTGQQNRTVAATDMNMHSSRSHLLVQIHGSMTTSEGKQLSSVITLVDLAGSERLAKSGVSGDRAKEAIAINKSLSALGDVINSRATKNAHTPYRNSALTHLLQDSLSGDSKTLMLLQVNPCQDHVEETLCSLTFGARVNAVEMSKK